MASVDRGASVQVVPAQDKRAQAFTIHQPSSAFGVYDNPSTLAGEGGAPTHGPHDHGTTLYIEGATGGIPGRTTFFKMQGWYVAGSAYETWVTPNAPNTSPPSGHSLSDIACVGARTP